MSPKRRLSFSSSPPPKRCHLSPHPSSPSSYRDLTWPPPSDSPTNPFGRKRTYNLTRSLPRATSFSKHLPLRFQIVNVSAWNQGRRRDREGVYRVVQVPLNYTFAHLRRLLGFLFGGVRVRALESGSGKWRGKTAAKMDEDEEASGKGHIFEVKKKVKMYSSTYKPGQVRSGETCAKLSTVRDPYLYRGELDFSTTAHEDEHREEGEESEEYTWTWEAEEDFTLGHAWPRRGDLARAIIYHHTPTTHIHITINTTPIPRRKGTGNTPFVFRARGIMRLYFGGDDDWRSSLEDAYSKYTHETEDEDTDADAEGDPDPECNPEDSPPNPDADPEDDPEPEYVNADAKVVEDPLSLLPWNAPDAFARYLKRVGYAQGGDETTATTTTASTPASSSSSGFGLGLESSPISVSSISSMSSLSGISGISSTSSVSSVSSLSSIASLPKPTITPAPHPTHRLRIDYAHRRIVRQARELKHARGDDSDEEEGEEIDELVEAVEDELTEEGDGEKKPEGRYKEGRMVGEVWDPFGDEEEL